MPARLQPNSAAAPYVEEVITASAARTATGNSATLSGYGLPAKLLFFLNCTAASGTTPTLNVTIEDTLDGSTWRAVATFTQKTAASTEYIAIPTTAPVADRIRVRWVIAGTTPSFTFSMTCASWAQ